jgi:hypothetical protein
MSPEARTLAQLSEVEPASLDSFSHLDQQTPSEISSSDRPDTEPEQKDPEDGHET